jgi:hypothetical protein
MTQRLPKHGLLSCLFGIATGDSGEGATVLIGRKLQRAILQSQEVKLLARMIEKN